MQTLFKLATVALAGTLALRWISKSAHVSPEASDHRIRERIRRKLGDMVRQPDDIEVVVNAGDVSLRGGVLASEADQLLSTVLAMPGVKHINNRLALRDDIPG